MKDPKYSVRVKTVYYSAERGGSSAREFVYDVMRGYRKLARVGRDGRLLRTYDERSRVKREGLPGVLVDETSKDVGAHHTVMAVLLYDAFGAKAMRRHALGMVVNGEFLLPTILAPIHEWSTHLYKHDLFALVLEDQQHHIAEREAANREADRLERRLHLTQV